MADSLVDVRADLSTILRQRAREHATRLAVRFLDDQDGSERSLSYEGLHARACAIATRLLALGARGERVLILQSPGLEYVACLFGCFYAGAVAVPTYPPRPDRPLGKLASVIVDARARFALTTQDLYARSGEQRAAEPELARLVWVVSDEIAGGEVPRTAPAPSDIALLQYTSGSTSAPKGVVLRHAHFVRNVAALASRMHVTPDDRTVSWLPPYHDMGLVGAILLSTLTGGELTLMAPTTFVQRPRRWLEAMSRYRATMSGGPNFGYELCVRRIDEKSRAEFDLSAWRFAYCGAERVRASTMRRFAEAYACAGFDPRVITPCYGLAEATLGVTGGPLDEPLKVERVADRALGAGKAEPAGAEERSIELVGCGRALDETEIVIVDPESCRALPERAVGEVWVRSPSVADGYFERGDLSEQLFRARRADERSDRTYLRTGDLGFLLDGTLYVTGRRKDLLILAGRNHYPEDIEGTIASAHPGLRVGNGVAFALEGEDDERLVIVYEIHPEQAVRGAEVRESIAAAVAREHELVVADVVLAPPGAVPKTSSGKLQRALCKQLYVAGKLERLGPSEQSLTDAPPELVCEVAAAMADVLGMASVGPDDDFLRLGGHSLMGTQLVARVRDRMKRELSLQRLFAERTPRRLAAYLATLAPTALPAIEPHDRSLPLPLSFSQERMWFLHQLEPHGAAYNVAGAVRIDGPLDLDALRSAFSTLLARHATLRTRYGVSEGEPRLKIGDERTLPLLFVDLRSEGNPEARAVALASELAAKPFDVARDLLIRVAIYAVGEQHHVLAASLHHLISDAWSMGVLMREVMHAYEQTRRGSVLTPHSPDVDYIDYAAWQRRQLDSERYRNELSYWKARLAGAEPLLLPTSRPRHASRSSRGGLELVNIPSDVRDALRTLGDAHGATPFMVLLAAFEVVLQRHSGQSDIVVGVPVANRSHVASEAFVGTLVNTLALRTEVRPELSFVELLKHVRERCLEAFDHQDLPFERLVSELAIERRPGASPLVQVMFDYQNVPMDFGTSTLHVSPVTISRGATQFDLSLLVHDSELGYSGALEYSTDLFDADAMARFAQHLVRVLGAVTAEPSRAIGALSMLGEAERARILSAAGTVRGETRGFTLLGEFAKHVAASPHARAVEDEHGQLDYRELAARVDGLARALVAQGAGPGERVAVHLTRSKEIVVALLAVLRSGAAYVPLDPRHPTARIDYVLQDATPKLVVSDSEARSSLPALACPIVDVSASAERDVALPTLDSARPAYVIYTSGSTGKPKGVVVPLSALDNFLASMARAPGLRASDRLLATTTITFDIAGLELLLPMSVGASLFVASSDVASDGERLERTIARFSPTVMQATPATWRMLIESGFRGNAGLTILCGGEALPRDLAHKLLDRAGKLWNVYGPTETTVWSLIHPVSARDEIVPIGRPIAETRVYVLDKFGALAPIDVAGEICIGGAGVADGYHNRPELTNERFVVDPLLPGRRMYKTGDLGRLRSDGTFEHLGRLDFQIKVRGFRIEPGEIESALKEHPQVREALVIAREDRKDDVRIVAYVVPASGVQPVAAELRDHLAAKLPEYMVPSAFVPLAALPHTPNGKIDRAALPAPSVAHAGARTERVAPRDEVERALLAIWRDVLGTSPQGIRDNFFALGGHSLLAVRLFARIRRELEVDLPLAQLFEAPTIEQLADRVRAAHRPVAPSVEAQSLSYVVPILEQAEGTPLFCVHGAGGNVIGLRALAQHLGRRFYGIQARGVDGVSDPFATIEEAASAYLEEIRKVQPHGPYYLSGYCGGGTIAFELARRLSEAGQRVAMLALLDTYRPGSIAAPRRFAQLLTNLREHGGRFVAKRVAARASAMISACSTALRIAAHRRSGEPIPHDLRDPLLTLAFLRAAADYKPSPYAGPMVILRAAEVDPQTAKVGLELGWSGYAQGGIEVHDVPGSHDTLLQEPNARALAEVLRRCLQRLDSSERTSRAA